MRWLPHTVAVVNAVTIASASSGATKWRTEASMTHAGWRRSMSARRAAQDGVRVAHVAGDDSDAGTASQDGAGMGEHDGVVIDVSDPGRWFCLGGDLVNRRRGGEADAPGDVLRYAGGGAPPDPPGGGKPRPPAP